MDEINQVEKLKSNDLFKKNNIEKILSFGRALLFELRYRDAYQLADLLEKKLNHSIKMGEITEIDEEYLKLISKLKTLALNFCTEKEIIDIFENKIVYTLDDINIDILERLKAKLFETFVEERDDLRFRLRRALADNKQILTSHGLIIDEKQVSGTVSNWISDYIKAKGAKILSKIEKADYFTNSKNVKKLEPVEKKKVKQILDIYEFLKHSSITLEGLEYDVLFTDDNGRLKMLSQGEIVDFEIFKEGGLGQKKEMLEEKQKRSNRLEKEKLRSLPSNQKIKSTPTMQTKPVATAILKEESEITPKYSSLSQQVKSAYAGEPKFEAEITKEEQNISQKVQNNVKILRDEFFKAVQLRNKARTIAAFRQLAKLNDLENFLAEDEKLQKFLTLTWTNKFGKQFSLEFERNPRQIKFVKAFIRYILEERLEILESDSARVAVKISNILKQQGQDKYQKMAYFDMKEKRFKYFGDSEH